MGLLSSFGFASEPIPSTPIPAPVNQPQRNENLASSTKPPSTTDGTTKVKPCCVCKEEKASRDECMLFSRSDDPQDDCKSMVTKYRECMKGYGFNLS